MAVLKLGVFWLNLEPKLKLNLYIYICFFSFLLCTRIATLKTKSSLAMVVLKLGLLKKFGIQTQRLFFFGYFFDTFQLLSTLRIALQ
jgi:hypothetical protein